MLPRLARETVEVRDEAQLPDLPVRQVATGHWVQLDDPEGVNRMLDELLASVDALSAYGAQTS